MYLTFQRISLYKSYIKTLFVLIFGMICFTNTLYSQQNDRDSLILLVNKSEINLQHNSSDSIYVDQLNKLAEKLRFYKADSLLITSKKALSHSAKINYQKGHIDALFNIGNYYSDKGNQDKAISTYLEALQTAINNNLTFLQIKIYKSLGTQYYFKDDYGKAIEEYLTGVEIANKLNDINMLSQLNENIAILYAKTNYYTESLKYFEIADELNKKINDQIRVSKTTCNIANLYVLINKPEHALKIITKSIKIIEKKELIPWLAFAYEVKGKAYLKKGDYYSANFWLNKSLKMHENGSVFNERLKVHVMNGIGEVNIGLEKYDLAENYALVAFEIASRLNESTEIIKSADILSLIYKNKKDFKNALKYQEISKKISTNIHINNNEKTLLMFKTKMNHEQQKENLIKENEKALAKQEKYIYVTLVIVFILTVITLLIRRSDKIQKKLNKELKLNKIDLEENQIKLKAINETKDKMFSIIGHDLRGPIGAFQGLLELFKNGEINQAEFLKFVPKLRTDIDNISFTLNNLLSWGQTQMNGAITESSLVSLTELVKGNINLLSLIADTKSIKLINEINLNTLVWCDANQIDIVIRNLMSNALKFTPKNGIITIKAIEMNDFWEVSVNDTGVGIQKQTLDKIFIKNSNITTYGTENEKGTGLGLILCKEMVENNRGEIWVKSILNEGTCFFFTVPKKIFKNKG